MSSFWTNTIWYILLGILAVLQLIIVLVKSERRSLTLAFYITILGITLAFETTILIFLDAYTYYPIIIPNPPLPFDDVLAGNLFSQFAVSATVLLVTAIHLNYYWFLIFPFGYGIIEESFLALGIYTQNWYQTWMTVTLLPFAFWIARIMYKKIISGIKPIFYYGYIYFGLFTLNIIVAWVFMLLRLQDFSMAMLPEPVMSRHFLSQLHFFMLSIPMMLLYYGRLKRIWVVFFILLIYTLYYMGWQLDLIIIKQGWFWSVSTLSMAWMYLSILSLDRLYGGVENRTLTWIMLVFCNK